VQCHKIDVLAPLIVVSCFTVPTAPHEGQTGGGVDLIEFSGIESAILPSRYFGFVPSCLSGILVMNVGDHLLCGHVRGPGPNKHDAPVSPNPRR